MADLVMSKGASPKGVTLVCFSIRFIKGVLYSNPIDLHAVYTQRRRVYTIEASKAIIWCRVLVTGHICRWRHGCWSQARPL